jgi:hypothetical protein
LLIAPNTTGDPFAGSGVPSDDPPELLPEDELGDELAVLEPEDPDGVDVLVPPELPQPASASAAHTSTETDKPLIRIPLTSSYCCA